MSQEIANVHAAVLSEIHFLSWESHRRTASLARELGLELVVLKSPHTGVRRYLELIPKTLRILTTKRPAGLVVQCPSVVLAVVVLLWAKTSNARIVIDAHNEAVQPFVNDSAFVRCLARWIHRHASLVIVTNQELAITVESNSGTAFVLPDPLPVPIGDDAPSEPAGSDPLVTVICTYAPDEPIDALISAARLVPARIVLTGNPRRADAPLPELPPNVSLSGYLPDEEYWALLRRSHVVVDLTTMPSCLVCGAYEALSLGVPMVLTDDPAARDLFGSAAVFVRNDPESIAQGINLAIDQHAERRQVTGECKRAYKEWWAHEARKLAEKLSDS